MRWANAVTVLRYPAQLVRRAAGAARYPFNRFTVGAKFALNLAQDEAERMQTSYIGAAHLLLGLLRESDGLASGILEGFGFEIDSLRKAVSPPRQSEPVVSRQLVPTTGVRRTIERAFDESARGRRANVGTDHLLAGLLQDRRGPAAQILAASGVTLAGIRERAQALLAEGMGDGTRSRRWADLALEKLSETAEEALGEAGRAATQSGNTLFNTEHILVGVLAQTASLGQRILERLGITADDVRPLLVGPAVASTGSEAHMTRGLDIGLAQLFRDGENRQSIDSAALLSMVLDGGGYGAGLLAHRVDRRQLDELVANMRAEVAPEKPIGRFSSALRTLWHRRAMSLAWAGRYPESRADLSVLLANAVTPAERAHCSNSLAWINLLSGDASLRQESLALAEAAVRAVPDSRAFRDTLALALIESGRPAEGVASLRRDGTDDPDPGAAAGRTATLSLGLWRIGDRDEARRLLKRADQLDPQAPLIARIRAEIGTPNA